MEPSSYKDQLALDHRIDCVGDMSLPILTFARSQKKYFRRRCDQVTQLSFLGRGLFSQGFSKQDDESLGEFSRIDAERISRGSSPDFTPRFDVDHLHFASRRRYATMKAINASTNRPTRLDVDASSRPFSSLFSTRRIHRPISSLITRCESRRAMNNRLKSKSHVKCISLEDHRLFCNR